MVVVVVVSSWWWSSSWWSGSAWAECAASARSAQGVSWWSRDRPSWTTSARLRPWSPGSWSGPSPGHRMRPGRSAAARPVPSRACFPGHAGRPCCCWSDVGPAVVGPPLVRSLCEGLDGSAFGDTATWSLKLPESAAVSFVGEPVVMAAMATVTATALAAVEPAVTAPCPLTKCRARNSHGCGGQRSRAGRGEVAGGRGAQQDRRQDAGQLGVDLGSSR